VPGSETIRERITALLSQIGPQDAIWEFWEHLLHDWEKQGHAYLWRVRNAILYHDTMLQTLKSLHEEHDVHQLLNLILDKAIELTQAERGFVLLENQEIARNFTGEAIVGEYQISRSIAHEVMQSKTPLLTDNARLDQRFALFQSIQEHRLISILCVPICLHDQSIGVIYLDNRLVRGCFQQADIALLSAFAEQSALAIYNARLHAQILGQTRDLQINNEELQQKVNEQTEQLALAERQLQSIRPKYQYHNLYSRNPKMQKIFSTIEKAKDSDIPVLILGDSGTGKELIAKAIHFSSIRQQRPFLSENCAAIPETLFESELFGHEKGAFTGAEQCKKGLFEQADGGTLFLDEIGELSLEMQKKLLRVLAEKSVRRVGGQKPISVNVRIVTATNRDLQQLVKQGQFREDLFYRLNTLTLILPPLRERKEDIPLLVEHFLNEAMPLQVDPTPKKLEPGILSIFFNYDWPGNVRQLRNEIFRLAALSEEKFRIQDISPEILSHKTKPESRIQPLQQLLQDVEKTEILKALEATDYNKSKAAQLLGISRFTLQRRMEKCGIADI